MYSESGWIAKAQAVFDSIIIRDVALWNTMIGGYVKQGLAETALNQYEKMQQNGICPSSVTYLHIMKACVSMDDIGRGRQIHAEILRNGMLMEDIVVGNTLIDMYVKAGLFLEAEEVFDMLPVRSVITWTALLAGYVKFGHCDEAIHFFKRMQHAGVSPNAVAFACALRACGSLEDIGEGHKLHAEILKMGFETDLTVGNANVGMYANCGLLAKAQDVFNQLSCRSVALWTVLINGYVNHEKGHAALACFDLMKHDGILPNSITFICGLKACAVAGAIDKGKELHTQLARIGYLDRELPVSNALIDMYVRCGSITNAQEVFDKLSVRDTITWTSLISGYMQHDCSEQAVDCFERMQGSGCSPSAATFVCILQAYRKVGAVDKGKHSHMEALRKGFDTNLLVGSTLVDMYAHLGALSNAQEVFKMIPVQDEALWNALITGYAKIGESSSVFFLCDKMLQEGKSPDLITYTIVLNTCSREGLVDRGQTFFESMSKKHGIAPKCEHHSCLIDLFARAGELVEAVAKVRKMPIEADVIIWRTMLSACQKWGNVNLGTHVFDMHYRQMEKLRTCKLVSLHDSKSVYKKLPLCLLQKYSLKQSYCTID